MKKAIYILVIMCLCQSLVYSQSWEKWYGKEDKIVSNWDVVEHYDKGYIISGVIKPSDYINITSWLIKTDINGDTLWSKIIVGGESLFILNSSPTIDGGILICGQFHQNNEQLPFAAKIDVCGEKEWCIVLDLDADVPAAKDIIENSYGDIGLLVFTSITGESTHLYKINSSGEVYWRTKICSQVNYPDSRSPIPYSLNLDNNENFIISGRVWWKNPWDDLYPITPYFAKVSSEGEELWCTPFGVYEDIHGNGNSTIIEENRIIGLGTKRSPNDESSGLMISLDFDGNIEDYRVVEPNEIHPDYNSSVFYNAIKINDKYYFKSSSGVEETGFPVTVFSSSTDLFGDDFEVFDEIQYPNCHYPIPMLEKTNDGKIINGLTDNEGDDRIYLTKLNQDLEQDSIYTENIEYDFLCDQEIESGFIYFNDCQMIVGTEDIPNPQQYYEQKQKVQIIASPNPALEEIKLAFENTENHQQMTLKITSILGQQVYEQPLQKAQTEQSIMLKDWQEGLYLVQVIANGKVVGNSRFLKM